MKSRFKLLFPTKTPILKKITKTLLGTINLALDGIETIQRLDKFIQSDLGLKTMSSKNELDDIEQFLNPALINITVRKSIEETNYKYPESLKNEM